MNRIGTDLIKQSKASHEDNKSSGRKDILSLLVQANTMEEDQPGRMTDEDVLDRVQSMYILNPTFRDPHFHHRWSRNNKVHTHIFFCNVGS